MSTVIDKSGITMGVEAASLTNLKKVRAVNRKTNM